MKIEKINIKKFGKLENKDISFEKGINLIEGDNESGKSTLMQFIFSIFFDFYKYKRNGIKEADIWRPWDDTVFMGSITYSLDNNSKYTVERDFNKRNPVVYDGNFKDISKLYLRNKSGMEILEEQINIDEEVFKNTVLSKQNLMVLDDNAKNILIHKILNQTSSGNENVSLENLNKKLNDKIRDEIGTNLTKAKPINIVENKLLELYKNKRDLDSLEEQKIKLEKDRKIVQERFSSSREKLELIKRTKELKSDLKTDNEIIASLKKSLNTKMDKQNKRQSELEELYKENIQNIKRRTIEEERLALLEKFEDKKEEQNKHNLKDNKEKNIFKNILKYSVIIILSLLILVVTNIIFKYYRFRGLQYNEYLEKIKTVKYLKYTNIGLITFSVINIIVIGLIDIIKCVKNNKKLKNIQIYGETLETEKDLEESTRIIIEDMPNNEINSEEKAFLETQIEYLNKDLNLDKINLENRQKDLNIKEANFEKKLLTEFGTKIDTVYIKSIFEMSDEKLNSEEGMLKQIYEKSMYSLSTIEAEKNELNKKHNKNLEIDEQIEKYEIEQKELIERREVIAIALKLLKDANDELKDVIDPNFINNFNKIIIKITDGKYSNINISDDGEIFAKDNEINKIVNMKSLSAGTIDQFNLAFRLTVMMNISEEKLPIIFDEAFVNYDNTRLKNILKYFESISNERQIILFTSNDRERRVMDKEDIKYKLINMN